MLYDAAYSMHDSTSKGFPCNSVNKKAIKNSNILHDQQYYGDSHSVLDNVHLGLNYCPQLLTIQLFVYMFIFC